jgi:hypothetical protein
MVNQFYLALSGAPFPGSQLGSVFSVPPRPAGGPHWQIQPLTGHAGSAKGIEEFDSYETNFALESDCWSTRRATYLALQPREIRPNTRVETKAVTGRSPNRPREESPQRKGALNK